MQNILKTLLLHWIYAVSEFLLILGKKHWKNFNTGSYSSDLTSNILDLCYDWNDCSDLTSNLLDLCTWPSPICHGSWKLSPPLSAYWRKFYWTGSSSSFPREPGPLNAPGFSENGTNRKGEQKQLAQSDGAALLSCSTSKSDWVNLGQQSCGQTDGDCNCLCITTVSKKNMWAEAGEHPPPNPFTTHCAMSTRLCLHTY